MGSPPPEQQWWRSPSAQRRREAPDPPPKRRRKKQQQPQEQQPQEQQQPQPQQQEQTSFLQPQELERLLGPPAPRPMTLPQLSLLDVIQKKLAQKLAAEKRTLAARQYRRWTQTQIDQVQATNPRRW